MKVELLDRFSEI